MAAPGIRVGQVWQDADRRSRNRTIRVDAVDATHVDATIMSDDLGKQRIGRHTRIAKARMKPTSTGYRLIADAPEWEAVLLDGRHEWWGIRNIPTGQLIAAMSGAPARWTTKALAEEDVVALGRDERPTRSLDMVPTVGDPFRSE
jgi:hypothetical protein